MTTHDLNDPLQFRPIVRRLLRRQDAPRLATPPATHRHQEYVNGQRGVSYDLLFGRYLAGARRITITDPHIKGFYQARNMMELLETIVRHKPDGQTVDVHLITERSESEELAQKQAGFLEDIAAAAPTAGIRFTWETAPDLHDRSIITDNGWKITLGRGLDIFERYDMHNAFDFQNRVQTCRTVKGFSMTVINLL